MRIRVEVSPLTNRKNYSGVAHYTKRLTDALARDKRADVTATYFNFLNRQLTPTVTTKNKMINISIIPLKIYAKLQSFNISIPFDILMPRADLTLFTNFVTWPTVRSKLRATVIHDLTHLHYPEAVENKNLAHLLRVVPRTIKKADFIITVSESVKAELVKEYALNPDDCLVTYIPPEPEYFTPNNNDIHTKYSLPTKKFILFLGNQEPRKNVVTLVAAYRQLPDTIKKEYSLVLAGGKGWKAEEARQAIKKAQEEGENIIHVGYVDQADSPAFFQKASVFALPSLYEGFGMQLLEAFAGKTPIVASDIPVFKEIGGDAVSYINPTDSADLSQKIHTLLTNPRLCDEHVKKGTERLTKFSWDKSADAIISYTEKRLAR